MPPPHPLPSSAGPTVPLGVRLRASFSQSGRTLGLVWRSSPGGTIALGVLTVLAASLPPLTAYLGKLIIDAVIAAHAAAAGAARDVAVGRAVRFVLFELAAVGGSALLERALGLVRQNVGSRLGIDVNVAILQKAQQLDLRHFEDPEFYDKLTRARREASSRPLSLIQGNFQLLRNALTLAGYIALLVRFSGWMVVALLAATVPAFIAEARFSGAAFRLRNWRSPDARRLNYLEYVMANDEHAKEVKLFGLGPLLLARYRSLAERFYTEDKDLATRRTVWAYLLSLVSTLVFYGCYALIVIATARGGLSLGDMTLYLAAFRQGQLAFQSILTAIGGMYEDTLYMSNLFEFLEIETTSAAPPALSPTESTATERGLRFDHVGFKYPEADKWALRDIDLFLPKGQSLALVGENGAGKTTFIKLLAGLYRPTEGRVLLDGRDLRNWDETELRHRIGVIFQDFNQYQLLVRENVGFGSVEHLDDEVRTHRAVDSGGAKELVAGLTDGLDTQLGRWFKSGAELSGGQWQKVALARAFMREEADILILDEPTAALDAEAEHAVFERFRQLTAGRTAILISHRFPTVRMADRILVLEHGRVIEDGSHAELLKAGARYAELFGLQASGYR
jgi:ABC-type multidrug transport system fused ATPase/permease subunit